MSSEDSVQRDREIIRLGKALAHCFFVLHKTAHNYARRHPALKDPVVEMVRTIHEIHRHREEASFSLQGGQLFAGETRMKPDASGFEALMYIINSMEQLSIGTLSFTPHVNGGELDEITHLMIEMEQRPEKGRFETLLRLMESRGVHGVEIDKLPEKKETDQREERDRKEKSKAIYSQTIGVISGVMDDVKLGKTLKLKKSKRIVMRLVDSLLTAETNLLGLTNIRSHDAYTFNHSVNVGILSLALGQRMGLHKRNLVELGMAAMFHDIGKSCIPLEILNKPSSFNPEEWAVMKRHPIFGVKELLKLKGADALTARIMMGAFEHHLNFDLSGYPAVPYGKEVSLFGRIISIADCYDAVSSSRVYSRTAEPPEKTLQFILSRSGSFYDPLIVKLFVNCVGVYPAGTLCRLSGGEIAVVLEGNSDPGKWNLPKVKIIGDANGNEIDGDIVDLSDGRSALSIAQTMNAEQLGIDVARYFV